MTILLLGSTGYIGKEFARQLAQLNVDTYKFLIPRDIRQSHGFNLSYELDEFYKNYRFDAVISVAGYAGKPNVDACEMDKHNTILGNVVLPQIVAEFCGRKNIPFGHVSSGCIYTGRREDGLSFTEDDRPNFSFEQNNCSFYSGTKALAEDIIRGITPNHYIWRLRIAFEENHNLRNYLSKMLNYKKLLDAENSISNKEDFVRACIECVLKKVPYGTYNVTNTGYVTTKQVVEKIKNTIGKDREFEFFDNDDDFYKTAAKTPRSNCVMSNKKLLDTGIKMRDVNEALDYCLNNWNWNK
jgi:UDP-glucose 4,6-dehydratase